MYGHVYGGQYAQDYIVERYFAAYDDLVQFDLGLINGVVNFIFWHRHIFLFIDRLNAK